MDTIKIKYKYRVIKGRYMKINRILSNVIEFKNNSVIMLNVYVICMNFVNGALRIHVKKN